MITNLLGNPAEWAVFVRTFIHSTHSSRQLLPVLPGSTIEVVALRASLGKVGNYQHLKTAASCEGDGKKQYEWVEKGSR